MALEKPFYKIVDDINKYATDDDKNKLAIRLQIPTLEIDQENINESNISSNSEQNHDLFQIQKKNCNPNANRKKSNWLFNALILLAIIFIVLSFLAFMLKLALVIKIIFVGIDVICCLPLIVLKLKNCYQKKHQTRLDYNVYQKYNKDIINKY